MARKWAYTKEMILEAAIKLFKKEGSDAITAKNIAKELNCSVAPIYSVYMSLDDLKRDLAFEIEKNILEEKEIHLLHIMETVAIQRKTDSLLVNHLPEVDRRATRVRIVTQKKSGIAGFFGGKKSVQVLPSAQELHAFSDSLIALQRIHTVEMETYADSLRSRNRTLNRELSQLISSLDNQAQAVFAQKDRKSVE